MRIYLAGPDVFRSDAREWAEHARQLCAEFGHQALTPLDNQAFTAARIYRANVDLLGKADCVIANLNPFRGAEPDSGTCVEVGMALANGKTVVGYLAEDGTLKDRLSRRGLLRLSSNGHPADPNGNAIEDFNLPLNLMLAVPATIVTGGLREALTALTNGIEPE